MRLFLQRDWRSRGHATKALKNARPAQPTRARPRVWPGVSARECGGTPAPHSSPQCLGTPGVDCAVAQSTNLPPGGSMPERAAGLTRTVSSARHTAHPGAGLDAHLVVRAHAQQPRRHVAAVRERGKEWGLQLCATDGGSSRGLHQQGGRCSTASGRGARTQPQLLPPQCSAKHGGAALDVQAVAAVLVLMVAQVPDGFHLVRRGENLRVACTHCVRECVRVACTHCAEPPPAHECAHPAVNERALRARACGHALCARAHTRPAPAPGPARPWCSR